MSQKSYDKSPTLYLIPTPIGNMEDITFRAINILKEVSVVFSEDTRVTGQLLSYFDIKTKLISNHEHNEHNNKEKILKYLEEGNDVGLVSDRGTPVISDPGYELSRFVIEQGYNVVALPGPTALIPALIASGLSPAPFTFIGFLNNKEGKRKNELEKYIGYNSTLIFYESPHRILGMLTNVLEVLGDREIAISREISKKFEEIYRGKVSKVLTEFDVLKGEFVVVIGPPINVNENLDLPILKNIDLYIESGLSSKDAIKKVAKERGMSKNDVYIMYHKK